MAKQPLTLEHWCKILHPNYRNYSVVIMNRPILWVKEHMFTVWKKAGFTVTVNDGIHQWMHYLAKSGVNLLSGQHNEYLPNVIIMEIAIDIASDNLKNMIKRLENLGSKIIYISDQGSSDYIKALQQVANDTYCANINLQEMYVFSQTIPNEVNQREKQTLINSDGKIRNIQIVIVSNMFFMWVLHRGYHIIHVPERQVLLKPACGLMLPPVSRFSTSGLRENFTSATTADLPAGILLTTYETNIITVTTSTSLIWIMGVDIAEEIIPKEDTPLDQL